LLAILRAFRIGKGDEVIVQAFTCVAVPNSVRWAGAVPIYADIDDTLNMNPADVVKKITKKTKAIIVQHTFGRPAKIDEIISIAKKNNLVVIEDFAHTMSIPMKGDAGFYSFGRDKVISSVFGGLAVMRDNSKLKEYHKQLEYPSYFWIFQQLFHPVAFSIILPLYNSGIGKLLLVFLQKIKFLSFPIYPKEKVGRQPDEFPKKYPNALAMLLLKQLKKLDRFTTQRKEISKIYGAEYPYLRFPKLVENPTRVIANAKKQGILLGNWYHNVIDPGGYGYTPGDCPKAEEAAKHIINLPTRILAKDAKKILDVLQ
jgi:selenocysteine lyase/cysteine desulfurase